MVLVPLMNPKFAVELAALLRELRVRGTKACPDEFESTRNRLSLLPPPLWGRAIAYGR